MVTSKAFQDITDVVKEDLCHSCGVCANVCHPDVISFQETVAGHIFPEINYEGCIACALCSAVCPGIQFGQTMSNCIENVDPFEGSALSSWVGKSKDLEIYENSQSGGIASAIVLDSLEKGIIDTAIVAVMSNFETIHGDVILAYTKADILSSQQSKYVPIPLLTAIEEVHKKKERFALVGLACHIHGLNNILDQKFSLREKFVFSVGLICDRVLVNASIDFLIKKTDINKKDVTEMYFRDKKPNGYPGDVHIKTATSSALLSSTERMKIKDFFTPARCRICFDKMNIGCDITVGDPHGLSGIDRQKGESIVIARTEKGQGIIEKMSGISIDIRQEQYQNILRGQHIDEKKLAWHEYTAFWQEGKRSLPSYYSIIKTFDIQTNNEKYKLNLQQAFSLKRHKHRHKIIQKLNRIQRKEKIRSKIKAIMQRIKNKLKECIH